ncbi:MAG: hypothetical protein QOK37_1569 [Thermoanaerobaculia bacterium]|jgi:hypothetical protein|nr:hypothetical protein [Thermoanaerobaculia bacterium]
MTTLTRSEARVTPRKLNAALRAVLVFVFWIIAAVLVASIHQSTSATMPVACVVLEVLAIVAAAATYIRFATHEATLDHALLTGTAWLLFGIATEIIMRMSSGHQWFALLGSPDHGGLRCVLLIAWVVAPALFANRRD